MSEETKSLQYDLRDGSDVHDNSMYEPDETMDCMIDVVEFVKDIIRQTYSLTDPWHDRMLNQRRQRMKLIY